MRGDWVYRGLEYTPAGAQLASQTSSYTGLTRNSGAYTLSSGTQIGLILYDSSNYMMRTTTQTATSRMSTAARAEGRRATVMAVNGFIFITPNAWTVGSNFLIGWRLVVCDQNEFTGALDLPAAYSFVQQAPTAALPSSDFAMSANGWGNLAEGYKFQTFDQNDASWMLHIKWRGRRSLESNSCLGLLMESAGPAVGSTTLLVSPRLRSLVHDPNS